MNFIKLESDKQKDKRQRMADILLSQADEPVTHPLQGLANLAKTYVAKKKMDDLDSDYDQRGREAQGNMSAALTAYNRSQEGGQTQLENGETIDWNKRSPDEADGALISALGNNKYTSGMAQDLQMNQIGRRQALAQQLAAEDRQFDRQKELLQLKQSMGIGAPQTPSSVREWEYFNSLAPQEKQQYLNMKRATLDKGIEYNEDGLAVPVDGYADSTEKISFADKKGAEEGKAEGIANAENKDFKAQLPALERTAGTLYKLADLATYNFAGKTRDIILRETGLDVGDAADAATAYANVVKVNILPTLKATFGGNMSIEEGKWLLSTLGDASMSPSQKIAAIDTRVQGWINQAESKALRVGEQPDSTLFQNTDFATRNPDPLAAGQAAIQQRQEAIGANQYQRDELKPEASKNLGGKNYVKINGQWYEK